MPGADRPTSTDTVARDRQSRRRQARRRLGARGQSLVEFAILLPLMLALVGILIDVARVYHAWINLESATRDAAQYLATSNPDSCDDNYSGTPPADSDCIIPATADQKAKYLLELSTAATFTISAAQSNCAAAMVTTTYSEDRSASSGGSTAYPVGIATVRVCMPFRTLFAYPLLTNNGNLTLRSEQTYRSLVGR